MAQLKFWAAKLGTNNQGQSLSLNGKDRILSNDDGKRLNALPDTNGFYSSKNGASVTFNGLETNTILLSGADSWNTTKTLKVAGDVNELGGKALAITNIVHAHVNLARSNGEITQTDTDISIDGAKRGKVNTGNGDDIVTIGIASNNAGWSNDFTINTRDGDDSITVKGASAEGFSGASLTTSGQFSAVRINSGDGNDTINVETHTSALDARLGAGDDTIALSYGDAQGGDVTIRGGAGNDTLIVNSAVNALDASMGKGDDKVVLSANVQNALINLGAGNDTFEGGSANATIRGGAGDDTFILSADAVGGEYHGGGGTDTFLLAGFAEDYNLVNIGGGQFSLTNEGTGISTVLRGIDAFNFDNGTADESDDVTLTRTEFVEYEAPVNDAPIASGSLSAVNEDDVLQDRLVGQDANSDALTYTITSDASNGTIDLNADGTYSYTPNENFNGSDSFKFVLNDGVADSNEATVTIIVAAVNDAPTDITLSNAAVDENADGTVIGALSATDVDTGDTVTFAVDDARFEVVGGQLKLKAGESLDFETEQNVTLEVTATDSELESYAESFIINVKDIDESVPGQLINGVNGGFETLIGGAGDDTIDAGTGQDVVDGREGDDLLIASFGQHRFVIGDYAGDNDTIRGFLNSQDLIDLTAFSELSQLSDLNMEQDGGNVVINLGDEQTLTIEGIQISDLGTNNFVDFDEPVVTTPGGSNDDYITVEGTDNNDGLYIHESSPENPEQKPYFVDAKAGDDTIEFQSNINIGDSTVSGGDGQDRITLATGNALALGGAGNDTFSSFDGIVGYFGDITASAHTLTGGDGADEFYFSDNGAYNHVITDFDVNSGDRINLAGFNNLQLFSDLNLQASGNDSLLTFSTIVHDGGRQYGYTSTVRLENVDVNDLRHYHFDGVEDDAPKLGTEGDDYLQGTDILEILDGLGGNDTIEGGRGNDTIYGGGGNDELDGEENDDVIYGDAGNDRINGGGGNNTIYGGDGDDDILTDAAFDASVYSAHNVIYPGKGDDEINAHRGYDRIIIEKNDGDDDIIRNFDSATDTVVLQGFGDEHREYTPNQEQDGNDVLVHINDQQTLRFTNMTLQDYIDNVQSAMFPLGFTYNGDEFDNVMTGSNNSDRLIGLGGNDRLIGLGSRDTLDGGDGDDTLEGGDGRDSLVGGAGANHLFGGDDNDTLVGGDDDDRLIGGRGYDIVYAGGGNDYIEVGVSTEFDNPQHGGSVEGGEGNDTIYGGALQDAFFGQGGDDFIEAYAGNNTLYGGDGDDTLSTREDSDRIFGGAGNDTISSGDGSDYVEGGDDNDTIYADSASGLVTFDGSDTVLGGLGNDSIYGAGGSDSLVGGDGDDYLDGGDGADTLIGGEGNDTLIGGDSFGTGDLNDYLDGGAGNDSIEAGLGSHTIAGGDGNDTIIGGSLSDIIDGGLGHDFIVGGAFADTIIGGEGNDTIQGGVGDNDTIYGGDGNDTFRYGINGVDEVWGNPGADSFIFSGGDISTVYVNGAPTYDNQSKTNIHDFNASEGDRILIENMENQVPFNLSEPGDMQDFYELSRVIAANDGSGDLLFQMFGYFLDTAPHTEVRFTNIDYISGFNELDNYMTVELI